METYEVFSLLLNISKQSEIKNKAQNNVTIRILKFKLSSERGMSCEDIKNEK